MNQRLCLFSLLIVCFLPCSVFAQLSIDTCIVRALENYPAIRQYALIEESTSYNLKNASKAYLPQLDITLVGGFIDGLPNLGANESGAEMKLISVIQLRQTIWDGGYSKAAKEKTSAKGQIQKAHVDVSMYAVRERVSELYFGVLLIQAQQKQLAVVKESLQIKMKQVQNAIDNGVAYKSDEDELLVELLNLEQKSSNLNYNKLAYLKMLGAFIAYDIDEDQQLEEPDNLIINYAQDINRPEVNLFNAQSKELDAQLSFQKAGMMPKFGVLGFGTFIQPEIGLGAASIDRILVAGLSVNWNLGSVYRNKNNKLLIGSMQKQIEVKKQTFIYNTQMELSQKGIGIAQLEDQIEKDQEIVKIKSRIRKAYEVKHENGICTMADYLEAVNSESTAQQSLTTHQLELLMRQYTFQLTQGIVE